MEGQNINISKHLEEGDFHPHRQNERVQDFSGGDEPQM